MKLFVKKEKKAKDPLLQTYFMSLLSLVLCVAMFMGTSFAWFTSDVASTDNQIFVGTLSMSMSHRGKGYTDWVAVGQGEKILNPDIVWEPGYTTVEWLKMENTGDLAFNYRLRMGLDTENADYAASSAALAKVGKYFTVYANTVATYEQYAANTPASFEELKEDENWVEVGTLDQVMLGKSILSGKLEAKAKEATVNPGKEFAIALHMAESADKEAMGQQLKGITVKLEAWQDAREEDAFGVDYDHLITDAKELKAAFAAGGKAVLAADVDMEGDDLTLTAGKVLDLDLFGYTIKGKIDDNTYGFVRVHNGATLNIRDSRGSGAISATAADDTYNGTTIWLEGQMNLYAGKVEKTAGGNLTFGVDVRPNAWGTAHTAPCELHIYGGSIEAPDTHAIRLTVNSSDSYADATASVVMDDGKLVGWDGVFVQMLNNTYRPMQLTINGGQILADNAAIRFYAPDPAKFVGVADGEKAVKITVNGGTFVSKAQTDGAEWDASKIVKFSAGTVETLKENVALVIANGLVAGKGQ